VIAGGVGLAGNVTTYLATKHQADNALKAEKRKIEADLDRLKIEQAEPHLQHRQGVYHDFLDRAHQFWEDQSFPLGLFKDEGDLLSWFLDFEHRSRRSGSLARRGVSRCARRRRCDRGNNGGDPDAPGQGAPQCAGPPSPSRRRRRSADPRGRPFGA
jgi:hypothetical protein